MVGFHKRKSNLDEKCMQRPDTNYGLSKCFGENIARLYADKFNIKGFCIRIGSCLDRPTDRRHLSTWISPNDLAQLVDIGISKNIILKLFMEFQTTIDRGGIIKQLLN